MLSDPPNIPDQHIYFTETDESRTLQCLAYGVPATYLYGPWKHLSYFGEYIRYLNASPDGKVTLPPIANSTERYQDRGIYLCTASNRVADSFGNSFQTGKIFVMSNGNMFLQQSAKCLKRMLFFIDSNKIYRSDSVHQQIQMDVKLVIFLIPFRYLFDQIQQTKNLNKFTYIFS